MGNRPDNLFMPDESADSFICSGVWKKSE